MIRLRVRNRETGKFVENVESISLDHLDTGYPTTFTAGGKVWAFGPQFELVVEGG